MIVGEGNATALAGATACHFGRAVDHGVLYVRSAERSDR